MKTRVFLKYFLNDCRFTYSPLGKSLEKETKKIEDQERKQIDDITNKKKEASGRAVARGGKRS